MPIVVGPDKPHEARPPLSAASTLGDGLFGAGGLRADLSPFDLLPPHFRAPPAQQEQWFQELELEEEETVTQEGWVAV